MWRSQDGSQRERSSSSVRPDECAQFIPWDLLLGRPQRGGNLPPFSPRPRLPLPPPSAGLLTQALLSVARVTRGTPGLAAVVFCDGFLYNDLQLPESFLYPRESSSRRSHAAAAWLQGPGGAGPSLQWIVPGRAVLSRTLRPVSPELAPPMKRLARSSHASVLN